MKFSHGILVSLLLLTALVGGFFTVRTHETRSSSQMASVAQSIPNTQENCIDEGAENFPCYESYYERLVHVHGISAAFKDLKARYPHSAFVQAQCHQLSHAIGHTASELYPTAARAFAEGDSFCWSGYYHGVMESLVLERAGESLPEIVQTLCEDIPGKESYSFDYYNCVHGLGHGAMTMIDGELFRALDVCGTLPQPWERSVCAGGVFMENVMAETRTGTSPYFLRDDPLYPCNAVADTYKEQCFLMQTSHILAVSDYDWKAVFTICAAVELPYRTACYQSIGRDASGQTISNAENTFSLCALGETPEARSQCITGAVKDFVSYFHSDTQAYGLCDMLTAASRKTCRATVASYYELF
ncbi:MAG: hypothetical protein A2591_01730 [Candidatus Yonathbacteria bacterium RIFOXYD1_FULL_52_36]|uniref:Uncharacterized protein n=1 Tax=Candidatus Yonathbacteria bacterium RIFOXYD1_FULL_52_36 TaxID=1802730 RepID=A0A1G2SMU1_9BACT|nr:MAG: hypothetical protein A2591_01730 [Candidatus Yonathbacteria bacterium RIFOXYD1_FULL_52_36]